MTNVDFMDTNSPKLAGYFDQVIKSGQRPTVSVIAKNENDEHLMVHSASEDNPFVWWPVQGGIEIDPLTGYRETPQQAAIRELKEEAGVVAVSPIEVLDRTSYPCTKPEGFNSKLLIACLAIVAHEPNLQLQNEEINGGLWMSRSELIESLYFNAQHANQAKARFLLDVFNNSL